mmetsp:Transcript_52859/g.147185  ORF Transcript_52859/g.147185 Transcript_52859/m.147185 type:complete len:230 (+) Transcript_52859:270-959(+)
MAEIHPLAAHEARHADALEGPTCHQPVQQRHRQKSGGVLASAAEKVHARDEGGEKEQAAGDGEGEDRRQGVENQETAGAQVRPEPRHHPCREQGVQAGGDRTRRRPHRARLLAAGALPEEGGALLHHQGQGPPRAARAQEVRLLRGRPVCAEGGPGGSGNPREELQRAVQRQRGGAAPLGWRDHGHQVAARHAAPREGHSDRTGEKTWLADRLRRRCAIPRHAAREDPT